jgi:hypothetical protein
MSLAIVVASIAGAVGLGMLSALVSPGRRRDDVELGVADEVGIFDVGGPLIDLEEIR